MNTDYTYDLDAITTKRDNGSDVAWTTADTSSHKQYFYILDDLTFDGSDCGNFNQLNNDSCFPNNLQENGPFTETSTGTNFKIEKHSSENKG